jgi:hypothetical protein
MQICPYLLSKETWREKRIQQILTDIKGLARELSTGKDILLIMGSKNLFYRLQEKYFGIRSIFCQKKSTGH